MTQDEKENTTPTAASYRMQLKPCLHDKSDKDATAGCNKVKTSSNSTTATTNVDKDNNVTTGKANGSTPSGRAKVGRGRGSGRGGYYKDHVEITQYVSKEDATVYKIKGEWEADMSNGKLSCHCHS